MNLGRQAVVPPQQDQGSGRQEQGGRPRHQARPLRVLHQPDHAALDQQPADNHADGVQHAVVLQARHVCTEEKGGLPSVAKARQVAARSHVPLAYRLVIQRTVLARLSIGLATYTVASASLDIRGASSSSTNWPSSGSWYRSLQGKSRSSERAGISGGERHGSSSPLASPRC